MATRAWWHLRERIELVAQLHERGPCVRGTPQARVYGVHTTRVRALLPFKIYGHPGAVLISCLVKIELHGVMLLCIVTWLEVPPFGLLPNFFFFVFGCRFHPF